MRRFLIAGAFGLSAAGVAGGGVFINEILRNPPGSLDSTREYIELAGTPGMKLDGYAIASISGMQTRFYPLGSIPPRPLAQEIDEFFSLDGLSIGPNGLLVIGVATASNYPTLLPDTNFQRWNTIWNGLNDTPGQLENDGSITVMLIRNRPGATQATHPTPPVVDLRWGKDVRVDDQLFTPVTNPQDGLDYDQYGDGSLDKGEPNNIDGGNTLDLRGASTPDDVSDDLEVVDEVSYEHDRGWEYDVDNRFVDLGSTVPGLPARRVHALDDPQGINPDAMSRVDYRTSGPGWPPAAGATGEMSNGNNWQDTATEQWIRGESIVGTGGQGSAPQIFYDNGANPDPNSIQPYFTNTPLWLSDGVGVDYDFSTSFTYQIMAGRVNPLAIPYIPGDSDRDGDCDAADIARVAAVFGDNDWIFSNSFAAAPEGDSGDPATQTRPWDVDHTGDNGIECSDLQWVLNFQGNTNGRIVGRTYDSLTPSATGVHLNSNAGVQCGVTTGTFVPSGRPVSALYVGDTVELTILGRVTAGVNNAAGQENGIMQYVHDLALSAPGVLQINSITSLAPFSETRAIGTISASGATKINGHATSFTQGLSGAAPLYRVVLQAIDTGSTTVSVAPAAETKFALSTPSGLKVGRTNQNGNPAGAVYPAGLPITVVPGSAFPPGDMNCDGVVNNFDIDPFVLALTDPGAYALQYPDCDAANGDVNGDGVLNNFDIDPFVNCLTGGC